MKNCKAIRCNDEMHCGWCGLQWSVSDDERPDCKKPTDVLRARHNLNKQEKQPCRILTK